MLHRRHFLAVAAASTLRAEPEPIGIGFLGASHSHFKSKFDVIRESKDWRIVAIAEPDRKIVEPLGVDLVSRDSLLADARIQVIAVESPVRDHAADGKAVLLAGKHLHLEKAPAVHLHDLEEVVNLARARNRLLQMGYMWRYHPAINQALEAARNGWLGPIYMLRATICNQLEAQRRPEWAEFKGGPMFELGGHVIDPIARLMGRPRKVTATLQKDSPAPDNLNDNTLAVLEWDKAIATVHSCNLQPGYGRYRSFEIYGANGSAIVNPIEPPALKIDLAKAAGPFTKGTQTIPQAPYRRFVADFADLAAAIRTPHTLSIPLDQELLVEETLLRCSGMAE